MTVRGWPRAVAAGFGHDDGAYGCQGRDCVNVASRFRAPVADHLGVSGQEFGVVAISGFSAAFLPEWRNAAVCLLKVDLFEGERRFVYVQDRAGQHKA